VAGVESPEDRMTLAEMKRMIVREGVRIIRVRKGKHIKLTVQLPDGTTDTIIVGQSESDRRAHLNTRSLVRRLVRQHTAGAQ
jgi:hypothetical protein